jgi:hypothetical protein
LTTQFDIAITLLLAGLLWLWLDGFKARETGIRAVRSACEADGLQLLDETIALARMRPRRDDAGRMRWFRVYQFEYSDTGDNRRRGSVQLLGHNITLINLGPRLVR